MKKLALVMMMVMGMVGCTKDQAKQAGCKAETAVLSMVSAQVGATLACKNLDAMMADMKAGLGKADLCKQEASAQGVVGAIACPLVVDTVVGLAVAKIPAAWECDPKATAEMLKEAAKLACEKAVKI